METIKRGTARTDSVVILQDLLVKAGFEVDVDGKFGAETEKAVMEFQRNNGLVMDGTVGPKTWRTLINQLPKHIEKTASKFLSEDDLISVAEDLDVELAAIKAVNEVESRGQGFIGDKPKILFEGHVFWNQLKRYGEKPQDYRKGNEDVLYSRWTRGFYLGGIKEYERLEKAKNIHENSAVESTSWGLFQIMGYHWASLGYPNVKNFVSKMHKNEGEHLKVFGSYIKVNKLANYLKNHEWAKFAKAYNGKDYKKNRYDEKLERAYERYK